MQVTPTIHQLNEQADWEMEGVRRAVERYEAREAKADDMALSDGQTLVRGIVKPLIAHITAMKDELMSEAKMGKGRAPAWTWPLRMIDPAKAAVVTLSVACGSLRGSANAGNASITVLSDVLAGALRDQVDYDAWARKQAEANKTAKEARDDKHVDQLRAMRLRYPNMSNRSWDIWVKRYGAAQVEWSQGERIAIGAALIDALVKVAPDRFSIIARQNNGNLQYFLVLGDEIKELMNDARERSLVSRPVLSPMICPPIPWRYE